MHSCHTTILLQIVHLTSNNNLTKYLSVAGVSSYLIVSLNIQKSAKKHQIWVRHPYIRCQIGPLYYFWAGYFCISEKYWCSNKRKNNWLDCNCFFYFLAKYRAEKPVCEPSPLQSRFLGGTLGSLYLQS